MEARMGSMRMLTTIKTEFNEAGAKQALHAIKAELKPGAKKRGQICVIAEVGGKGSTALIDSGTSHNFIDRNEAMRLDIKYGEEESWLKTVNS